MTALVGRFGSEHMTASWIAMPYASFIHARSGVLCGDHFHRGSFDW